MKNNCILTWLILLFWQNVLAAESLRAVSRLQIKNLKCIEKILLQGQGPVELVAQKTVDHFSRINSVETMVLKDSLKECQMFQKYLTVYEKFSKESLLETLDVYSLQDNYKKIIKALVAPELIGCKVSEVTVTAGILFNLKAGINSINCIYTNGKVRRYVGPALGVKGGFGAIASIAKIPMELDKGRNSAVAGYSFEAGTVDYNYSAVYGRNEFQGKAYGHNIGMGIFYAGAEAGFGFRIFNIKRDWKPILELLEQV